MSIPCVYIDCKQMFDSISDRDTHVETTYIVPFPYIRKPLKPKLFEFWCLVNGCYFSASSASSRNAHTLLCKHKLYCIWKDCGANFNTIEARDVHSRACNPKKFHCDKHCNKYFSSESARTNHARTCKIKSKIPEPVNKSKKLLCYWDDCNKTFSSASARDNHVKTCKPIKYKKKNIDLQLRIAVWRKYMRKNKFEYKCPVCLDKTITAMDFDCGHILAESKGGPTTVSNMKPICNKCNQCMGTMHMDDYFKKLWLGRKLPTKNYLKKMVRMFKK